MTDPSIQSTTGPSTSGPLISEASLVPTIPMISTGIPADPPSVPRPMTISADCDQAGPSCRANARSTLTSARGEKDNASESEQEKRPLVAVGYGPRCVPVMQLTEAAASICDLLWMIDGSISRDARDDRFVEPFRTRGRHQRS